MQKNQLGAMQNVHLQFYRQPASEFKKLTKNLHTAE